MEKVLAICSVCDEGVENPYFCEDCGEAFCESCSDVHLIEEGNGTDDIRVICDTCIRERRGM